MKRMDVVLVSVNKPSPHEAGTIIFLANQATAGRFGQYGRLKQLSNPGPDLRWRLVVSQHYSFRDVEMAFRKQAGLRGAKYYTPQPPRPRQPRQPHRRLRTKTARPPLGKQVEAIMVALALRPGCRTLTTATATT